MLILFFLFAYSTPAIGSALRDFERIAEPSSHVHARTAASAAGCGQGLLSCDVIDPTRLEAPWKGSNDPHPQCYDPKAYVCLENFLCPSSAPVKIAYGCFVSGLAASTTPTSAASLTTVFETTTITPTLVTPTTTKLETTTVTAEPTIIVMPRLSDISYSQNDSVAAVRDYYTFLTKMYLPNSVIQEPPADGWPTIPVDRLRAVGKSDEVIKLLQHLPYVLRPDNYFDKAQVAPDCYFADYRSGEFDDELNDPNGTNFRIVTEGLDYESVPSHVIGLTSGGRYNPIFLLDTILGIVHWTECPDGPRLRPSRAGIWDRADTYAPVNEQEWRTDAPAWAIVDFFELLKDQFESLDFVPISSKEVLDAHETYAEKDEGMIPMVQAIYRDHGWPDLEVYRKEECLEAVAAALKENYPDYANESDSEDE